MCRYRLLSSHRFNRYLIFLYFLLLTLLIFDQALGGNCLCDCFWCRLVVRIKCSLRFFLFLSGTTVVLRLWTSTVGFIGVLVKWVFDFLEGILEESAELVTCRFLFSWLWRCNWLLLLCGRLLLFWFVHKVRRLWHWLLLNRFGLLLTLSCWLLNFLFVASSVILLLQEWVLIWLLVLLRWNPLRRWGILLRREASMSIFLPVQFRSLGLDRIIFLDHLIFFLELILHFLSK